MTDTDPVGEPLPEGWHHIPWTSKEDGVGAPETPASGESGPPAPPALCVGCGHDIGLHNEKGCLHGWAGPEGLCRCRLDGSQVARVPVNDEAEAAQLTEALRKKIAVEIETEELTLNAEIGMSSWWVEGMRHAARIAREGRP